MSMPHPAVRALPTLHRELVAAFAVVFAGALLVGAIGVVSLLSRLDQAVTAAMYLTVLLAADVAVFALFGRYVLKRRVLAPLDRLVEGVEAIAAGDYTRRLPPMETAEISRVTDAVNRMAEGLITHREQLAANIRSLEETNAQLTEARDELVRVEKMASVGRLAAGIAHEIGNPLSAILGYLGIMARSAGERERELLAAAEREARRIDRIVRGLLDYARPREARVHPIAVNEVVERALELLSTQGCFQKVRPVRDLAPALPEVEADPYQLEQVLVNLLLNATDALDDADSPALVVTTARTSLLPRRWQPTRRKDDPPGVDYTHRRRFNQSPRIPRENPFPAGGEVVEIAVRDNGSGIPAHLLDQIFEPFVTTKEPGRGTGLGLAVAARLIDAMGGTIRAESQEGHGATFTVVLPAAAGTATEQES